jgi:hypothetical protein
LWFCGFQLLSQKLFGAVQVRFRSAFRYRKHVCDVLVRIVVELVKTEDQPVLVWQFLDRREQILKRKVERIVADFVVNKNIIPDRHELQRFFVTGDRLVDRDPFDPALERALSVVGFDVCENLNKGVVEVVLGFRIVPAILEAQDEQRILIRLV